MPLILEMVKQVTGMRFAAVARVTDKHWVTCAVDDSIAFGLIPGSHLELETTICHEIRQNRKPVIFTHASTHPVFSVHHTPKLYGLESYVSIPIVTANGHFFGTLCAMDPAPASFDESSVLKTMELYAQLIAMNLDLHKGLLASEQALEEANEAAVLREQFVAVLGHDLRTPLSAVRLSAELLETRVSEPSSLKLVRAVRHSAIRMGILIEDVLDFARGELGGGIPIKPVVTDNLQEQLEAVLMELRVVHPRAVIRDTLCISSGLNCDPERLAQVLSNLVDNAVTHGAKGMPVEVSIHTVGQNLVLSVHNSGPAIPKDVLRSLFHPFKRLETGRRKDGLGLGLYIANEICKGHRGTLEATSNDVHGTEFVATLPCVQPS